MEMTENEISRVVVDAAIEVHGLIKRVGRPYKYYLTKIGRAVALAGLKLRSLVLIPELASAAAT